MITDEKLDVIFSKLVRTKSEWRCDRCGADHSFSHEELHCSHFMGRRYRATRWDFDNCFAHCRECHHYLGLNPVIFRRWALKMMGNEKYHHVRIKAETVTKLTEADKERLYSRLKNICRELGNEND